MSSFSYSRDNAQDRIKQYDRNSDGRIDSKELRAAADKEAVGDIVLQAIRLSPPENLAKLRKDMESTVNDAGEGTRRQLLDTLPILKEDATVLGPIQQSLKAKPDHAERSLKKSELDVNALSLPAMAEYYKQYDSDNSGSISIDELRRAAKEDDAGALLSIAARSLYLRGYDSDQLRQYLTKIAITAGGSVPEQLSHESDYNPLTKSILQNAKSPVSKLSPPTAPSRHQGIDLTDNGLDIERSPKSAFGPATELVSKLIEIGASPERLQNLSLEEAGLATIFVTHANPKDLQKSVAELLASQDGPKNPDGSRMTEIELHLSLVKIGMLASAHVLGYGSGKVLAREQDRESTEKALKAARSAFVGLREQAQTLSDVGLPITRADIETVYGKGFIKAREESITKLGLPITEGIKQNLFRELAYIMQAVEA